jgi:L-alanine-DL-glutamate epimerase-like enolase superfamily enzyme
LTLHELLAAGTAAPGVLPDWTSPARLTPAIQPWAENTRRFAVRIADSDGNCGYYGPVSAAIAAIVTDQIAPAITGQDAWAWRQLPIRAWHGRHSTGAHARLAVSAVELALWDLRSRAASVIVADLLGGSMRSVIPAYATALGIDIDHPLAADIAAWITSAGFWGQKWALPGYGRGEPPVLDGRRLVRIRAAAGDEARLCVDAGGQWDASYARQMLPVLAECQITWLEEPGAADATELTRFGLPCAAGEHAYDAVQQIRCLTGGTVHAWQPDPSWHGGLTQSLRIAELAVALLIPCFPHGSGLAAGLHLASLMSAHDVPAVEYHLTLEPMRQAIHTDPLLPDRGKLTLSGKPGITAPYRLASARDRRGHAA